MNRVTYNERETTLKNGWRLLFWIVLLAASQAFSSEPTRKTIVVLGDSIAAGYGVEQSEAFPSLLQERIAQKSYNYEVVNAGVSGDTTASGVRRMPWLLQRRMDVLLIELGGNDGLRGIAPSETRSNLEKIIVLAREKYPKIKIVLAGMQMPQNMGADYTSEFKEVFPTVAKEKGARLIPFVLDGVGGKAELNQDDRIHPNPAGHKIVAENIWKVLEPILVENSKPVIE